MQKKLIPLILGAAFSWLQAQPLSLSITNQNLALVEENRTLKLEAGNNRISLADLPALLDPTSVHVDFGKQPVRLLEQRFVSPAGSYPYILEKMIGRPVRLLDRDFGTIQGTLLSVSGNSLIIKTGEKELSLIPDYSKSQIVLEQADSRVISLLDPPALFWSLQSDSRTEQTVILRYLTAGLNWSATYTAVLNEQEDNLFLSALVSLNNLSGKSYRQADLTLIAGELNKTRDLYASAAVRNQAAVQMMQKSEEGFSESVVSDFHIFRLGKKIDLEDQEQKEIPLFPAVKTMVEKRYNYNYQKDIDNVSIRLNLKNDRQSGLGTALPAGLIRVYKKDAGQLLIMGEDRLANVATDEKIDIEIGKAFDIIAERKIIEQRREGNNSEKTKISIELRNQKEDDILVLITEPLMRHRQARLLSSNFKLKNQDASKIEFELPVKAKQATTLNIELLYSW